MKHSIWSKAFLAGMASLPLVFAPAVALAQHGGGGHGGGGGGFAVAAALSAAHTPEDILPAATMAVTAAAAEGWVGTRAGVMAGLEVWVRRQCSRREWLVRTILCRRILIWAILSFGWSRGFAGAGNFHAAIADGQFHSFGGARAAGLAAVLLWSRMARRFLWSRLLLGFRLGRMLGLRLGLWPWLRLGNLESVLVLALVLV